MTPEQQRAHELSASPDVWVGRFTAALALCLDKRRTHGENQRMIRRLLAEFMVSPVSTEYLRDTIRSYL